MEVSEIVIILLFYIADTYMVCSLCKNVSTVYLQFVHFLYISYSLICMYTSFNSVLKKQNKNQEITMHIYGYLVEDKINILNQRWKIGKSVNNVETVGYLLRENLI